MSTLLKTLPLAVLFAAAPAFAHPHKTDTPNTVEATKAWPNFGDEDEDTMSLEDLSDTLDARMNLHSKDLKASGERMKSRMLEFKSEGKDHAADDIRGAAKALEAALGESGILSSLANVMADFAEDIELETDDAGAAVLRFDGKTLGKIKREKSDARSLQIQGLGKDLSIERETFIRNGETKTRIVIEMDGGDEIEIKTPSALD